MLYELFKVIMSSLRAQVVGNIVSNHKVTLRTKNFQEIPINHTVDTEFSVTNCFCLHFSEHAQWGLPVISDILVKIFVDISCNICGLFLL